MEQLFLVAHIAGRAIAIGAEQVESVVDVGSIVPVPGACDHVRGLTALRSRVVTVIDTVTALGMNPAQRTATRAVITRVDGHHYALLVDALEDVVPLELQPLATGIALTGAWRAAGRGLVQRDGEPILVIDLTTLIPGLGSAGLEAA